MRIDELRKALRSQPFRPFLFLVADGRGYSVKHPDFMALSPTGRTIIVYGSDDLHDEIDALMITSIHIGNGERAKKRKSG